MSLYSKFKTNSSKVKKGIEVKIEEAIFILRPMSNENKEYQKALADMQAAYRVQLKTNTLPDEKLRALVRDVFCQTVLIGWKNVTDEDGKELEFNHENTIKVMEDLDAVYTTLLEIAQDYSSFVESGKEADLKN